MRYVYGLQNWTHGGTLFEVIYFGGYFIRQEVLQPPGALERPETQLLPPAHSIWAIGLRGVRAHRYMVWYISIQFNSRFNSRLIMFLL